MKKFLIPLTMMCLGMVPAKAEVTDVSTIDNVVYLNPVTASPGTQCVLSVQMKNTVEVQGFGFDLYLPDGVTVAKDEDGFNLVTLSTERTTEKKTNYFDSNIMEDGALRVLASSTSGYTISGTDGEIVQVVVNISPDMEAGDYPIILREIALSDNNSQGYETELVETTITIEASDGRIHFDENATTLPSFTSGDKGDVTMARTITAGKWSSIVLPFTLTQAKAKEAFGDDVTLAEFSGFEVDYGDDEENVIPLAITLNFTPYTLSARKPLTGGKPFLIKTSRDITTIEADDVTLVNAVSPVEKKDEWETKGSFTGSLVKTKVPEDCLFLNDNKFWYSVGQSNIKAFRGWFDLDAVLDKETAFDVKYFFFIDGTLTQIEEVTDGESAVGKWFDLNGRQITKPQRRGIYIVNGSKVVK